MVVPTYSWNVISTSQTDADSPLDETLMDALRENQVHLEEWLGDGYTAEKDHDHDNVNSKAIAPVSAVVTESSGIAATVSWYPDMTVNAFYSTTADIRLEINHITVGWIDTANTVGQAVMFDVANNVRFRNSDAINARTVYYQRHP